MKKMKKHSRYHLVSGVDGFFTICNRSAFSLSGIHLVAMDVHVWNRMDSSVCLIVGRPLDLTLVPHLVCF